MEAALATEGRQCITPKGSLRHAARQLMIRAGEETAAFREVADRLDGKPAQAIVGGEDGNNPIAMRVFSHSRPQEKSTEEVRLDRAPRLEIMSTAAAVVGCARRTSPKGS